MLNDECVVNVGSYTTLTNNYIYHAWCMYILELTMSASKMMTGAAMDCTVM